MNYSQTNSIGESFEEWAAALDDNCAVDVVTTLRF